MGQYYKPVFLKEDKKTPYLYGIGHTLMCGIKLMEHAYIENPLLHAVLNYMWDNRENTDFRLVWAGDYADPEIDDELNGIDSTTTLYDLARGVPEMSYDTKKTHVRFIVNKDKKEYVDLWHCPEYTYMVVHPLALLTAEGNGRGGGDYKGTNMKLVGSWARDTLTVLGPEYSNDEQLKKDGYTELVPDFIEAYELERTLTKTCAAFTSLIKSRDYSLSDSEKKEISEKIKQLKQVL